MTWRHKDREYRSSTTYDLGKSANKVNGYAYAKKIKNKMSFEKWLDLQCKGGWSVLKISRNFTGSNTWCVFRKKID